MNTRQIKIYSYIKSLSSEEAARWLIDTYHLDSDDLGDAYTVIQHRSWRKNDQINLANYFLDKQPHASPVGYEAFLSFMSIPSFIRVMKQKLPEDRSAYSLLLYHLDSVLKKHSKNEKDNALIENFLSSLHEPVNVN